MNNYYKNFVLCGEVDYHCLLCQESFQNKENIEKHLIWEKHRKSLKKQECDGAYKKESIYKVRDSYYCEICNEVATNAKKHKELATHIDKKSNPGTAALQSTLTVKRETDNAFTIDNNLKIGALAWHGIKNDFCTLCKRGIRDPIIHVNLNVHVVNLIACKTKSYQEYYYRQISDGRLYCFLCCHVFPNTSLETHWSQECEVTFKANLVLNKTDRQLIKNDPELANALYSIQKLFFNIDTANNKAECMECKTTVAATLDVMLKHRNKHTSKGKESESSNESYQVKFTEVVDHGKRRHEIAAYGRDNYIKLNQGGSWGYCSLCDVSISAHMKQMIDHVQGIRHRGFLEYIGVRKGKSHAEPNVEKVKMTNFLSSVFKVENENMYYVKDHMPVTEMSFMLMKELANNGKKVKCYACDVIVDKDAVVEHFNTKPHKAKVLASYVIKSAEGMEFLRLIRPNLYHCGICNVALAFWDSAMRHVSTLPHTFNKSQKMLQCGEVRDLKDKHRIVKQENIMIQLKKLGLY